MYFFRFCIAVFLLNFLSVVHLFGAEGTHSVSSADLVRVLNRFPVVRVGITGAPGNGHQAPGVSVVEGLRNIGYDGKIEIIYDSVETARKLIYLLPPFKGPDYGPDQQIQDMKLRFVAEEYFSSANEFATIQLAIMGADDKHRQAINYKAKDLLKLQPKNWVADPILELRGHINKSYLSQLNAKGYLLNTEMPPDTNDFLVKVLQNTPFEHMLPLFKYMLSNIFKHHLLPVYSHGIRQGRDDIATLLEVLAGMNDRDKATLKNGVIIPIFNKISDSYSNQIASLSDKFNSTKNIKVKYIEDFNSVNNFDFELPNTVLIVNVGSVPKPLFELTYKLATLPSLVEGLNSIDMVSQYGIPYLPTSSLEGFHFIDKLRKKKMVVFFQDTGRCCRVSF